MSSDDHMQPLFNALPPAVAALALALFSVEVVLWLASEGIIGGPSGVAWRRDAALQFGFPGTMLGYFEQSGTWLTAETRRFVTYPFVHFGFVHAMFVIVFLLALGKLVGEVFGNLSVLIVFFGCALVGALAYALITGDPRPLIGGYPSVYGLIGAYTFILWMHYGAAGENQYRAFMLIGLLLGIQLVFGLLFGSGNDWIAEISGFTFGFLISPALAPGGFRRLLAKLRQR